MHDARRQAPGSAAVTGAGSFCRRLVCRPALLFACPPQCPGLVEQEERGSPASWAGESLTFAPLTTAEQQVRPRTTSSRRPMVRACLWVALPPARGYL